MAEYKRKKAVKIIDIDTKNPYKVLAGSGLLKKSGELIKEYAGLSPKAETAVIITDDSVDRLYSGAVEQSAAKEGFRVLKYIIPHGEASKSAENYIKILEYLAENAVTRSDFIIALGGGVVGDMAGFAAATFLRKIDFIQIPTSLLACVDSSVGGKTGIDLKAGKNLAGAFHQPKLVICDLDVLDTLPEEVFRDGCAEVIKYGVLFDEKLFRHLKNEGIGFDREYVVPRCIELKRDVVVEDEFDNGKRQLLNLGHTLAHAAEMKSDFRLSHGRAVAIGMTAFSGAAADEGICGRECAEEIRTVIEKFGLPTKCEYNADELYDMMLKDKKRKGSSIFVIVPERIGRCSIKRLELTELRSFIEKGLI